MNVVLDRSQIEQLLPQKGAMCLIDTAVACTEDSVVCRADAARADHPLREAGGVAAEHAIEYGAQAAALHRRLSRHDAATASAGLLLQVKHAEFHVRWLDRLAQPLQISAQCVQGTSEAATYRFEVRAGATLAASGELTVRLAMRKL